MLRGVRVVEGADLERLCGVTHRGFESLPLSHNSKSTRIAGFQQLKIVTVPQFTKYNSYDEAINLSLQIKWRAI